MLYRVYYAAFVKDSSATGAPPTPYKIVDVKSEPAPTVTTTGASVQQQAMSFSYPATHPVPSSFQNSIPSVTNTSLVAGVQPRLSDHQPPVAQFHPPPMPEATQPPQSRSDAPPSSSVSSYQPSAPPPGGSNWNDPPVVVKTKKVIINNATAIIISDCYRKHLTQPHPLLLLLWCLLEM